MLYYYILYIHIHIYTSIILLLLLLLYIYYYIIYIINYKHKHIYMIRDKRLILPKNALRWLRRDCATCAIVHQHVGRRYRTCTCTASRLLCKNRDHPVMMMMFTPERHLPTSGQHGHSPQRHTAAGTAAPTTADTGNTVPQRANPTQTAYAHLRRRAQAQGQRLGTWTLVRPQKALSEDGTQWYHRKIGTSTITVPDVGLRPGFLPPRRAGVYLPLNLLR